MSDEDTKHPVADETEGQAMPEPEESSAQEDDLDKLLREYDDGTQQAAQKQQQQPSIDVNTVAKLEAQMNAMRSEFARERDQKDINSVVESLSNGVQLPNEVIEGTLHKIAADDPKVAKAFASRFENPQAWAVAQKRIHRRFSEITGSFPDREVTSNRTAMTAAIRRASKQAPDDEIDSHEVRTMSDQDFEAWVRKQARKNN